MVLNYQFHVDVQFTTQDLALSMDMFKKRILSPQIATVANRIDADSAQYYTYNTATPWDPPAFSPHPTSSSPMPGRFGDGGMPDGG